MWVKAQQTPTTFIFFVFSWRYTFITFIIPLCFNNIATMFHEKHYYNPLPLHLPCNVELLVGNMPPFSALPPLFSDLNSPLFRFQLSPFPPKKPHQPTKKSIDFAISHLISTFALST